MNENEVKIREYEDFILNYCNMNKIGYFLFLKKGEEENEIHSLSGNVCWNDILSFVEYLVEKDQDFRFALIEMLFTKMTDGLMKLEEERNVLKYNGLLKETKF